MYFMLQTELPFGSWRDNELEIFGRIARRQLTFPSSFSPEAVDLIDEVNFSLSKCDHISYEAICVSYGMKRPYNYSLLNSFHASDSVV